MSSSSLSPLQLAGSIVNVQIKADGKPLNSNYQVVSVDIWTGLNAAPKARLVIADGNPADDSFPISDSTDLIPGAALEISLGYDGTAACVFTGLIYQQGINAAENSSPQLVLEALGDKSAAAPPDTSAAPVLTLAYGVSIQAFRAEIDQQSMAEPPSSPARIRGEVRFQGSALATTGAMVTLAGVGKRYNGAAYISGLHHHVGAGQWYTSITIGLPASHASAAGQAGNNVSRDGLRLDEKTGTVTIKDSNGSTITLASNGVTIDSANTLTLLSKSDIVLNAQGTLSLQGTAGVKITGTTINAAASSSFTAQGLTEAKLGSSGVVTVQGALVKIN